MDHAPNPDVTLTLTAPIFRKIRRDILLAGGREHFGLLLGDVGEALGGLVVPLSRYLPALRGEIEHATACSVRASGRYIRRGIETVNGRHNSLIQFHNHPGSGPVRHSAVDDRGEREVSFPEVDAICANLLQGSLVFNQDCTAVSGRIWRPDTRSFLPVTRLRIVGRKGMRILPADGTVSPFPAPVDERLGREGPLHSTRFFETVRRARLCICGQGGLGSDLLECLVHLPWSEVILIDPDVVSMSDLNRHAFATHDDARHAVQKVSLGASRILSLFPDTPVIAIGKKIEESDAMLAAARADIVATPLDKILPRQFVNRLALAYGMVHLDLGTQGTARSNNDGVRTRVRMRGQTMLFSPVMGCCLSCVNFYDPIEEAREALSEADLEAERRMGYIDAPAGPEPSIKFANAMVAAMGAQHLERYLDGEMVPDMWAYREDKESTWMAMNFAATNGTCPYCHEGGYRMRGNRSHILGGRTGEPEPIPIRHS